MTENAVECAVCEADSRPLRVATACKAWSRNSRARFRVRRLRIRPRFLPHPRLSSEIGFPLLNRNWHVANQRAVILSERKHSTVPWTVELPSKASAGRPREAELKDPAQLQPKALQAGAARDPSAPAASPLIASRCLPAPALRARECNSPLDCCMLRMATCPGACRFSRHRRFSSGIGFSWQKTTLVCHRAGSHPEAGFLDIPLTRQNGEGRN